MTCFDVEQLLDGFVDTELPAAQLLDVARHAAGCTACDMAIRDLAALRQSVAELVEREARSLDLSPVWPAVAAAIASPAPPTTRRARILPLRRGVPAAPLWGALMALAASVFVWLSGPSTELATQVATQVASIDRPATTMPTRTQRPATAIRPMRFTNDADIDRLAGKDIAVRREPKSGTTIIWVNHFAEAR
jgi:anti-sigma factor RsiW